MNQSNKQYNQYYENIIYEGKHWRLYDELETDSYTALYSETQIKLIELIEKHNFKIFYINCSSKSKLQLTFEKPEHVDLNNKDVMLIKQMLSKDLYYLYEHQLFEVIYTIPKLTEQNNYFFNILLVVNKNFDLNSLNNHSFNLININSVQPIFKEIITYEWVEKKFSDRNYFHNNSPHNDENHINDYYDLFKLKLNYEEFTKNNSFKNEEQEWDEYQNASSLFFYINFNQNLYAKNCFMLLDMQIWSLDKNHVKLKSDYGFFITDWEKYDINSGFVTNFAELAGGASVNIDVDKTIRIIREYCTYCSLRDNYNSQYIVEGSLSKNSIKTGFADLSNLELKEKRDIYFNYE